MLYMYIHDSMTIIRAHSLEQTVKVCPIIIITVRHMSESEILMKMAI